MNPNTFEPRRDSADPGPGRTLVLGLGNVLARDDGVGIEVVRRLAARWTERPEAAGIDFVDGGTLGLELLGLVAGSARVVVVDAVALGARPGTVTLVREALSFGRRSGTLSVHELGLGDLMAAARLLGAAPSVLLVAVEPAELGVGLGLSPTVAAAVPSACAVVEAELGLRAGVAADA